jgi:hypothetical protein
VGSVEFASRLRDVGRVLRRAGVTSIVLVHGTFVGDDYFDIAMMVERVSPRLAGWLRRFGKAQPDWFLGDGGNYTKEYVQRLAEAINEPGERAIDVRRFIWSGGNSHFPRAVAAVRLIDEIATLPARDPHLAHGDSNGQPVQTSRVLCFGHSHGANAVALATNLLGGDRATRRRFLDLVRDVPGRSGGGPWLETWRRACDRLDSDAPARELLGGRRLDLVMLGTPIRYGWDSGGYDKLLHIMNQRPVPGIPPWRGKLPRTINEVMDGRNGDWVQQLGTAGSNFPLLALRWRRWRAERRLAALLQQGEPSWRVLNRMRQSLRVADEGTTLLVDFGLARRGRRGRHVFGHGVYTNTEWLPFQLELVAGEFYAESAATSSRPPAAVEAAT